MTRSTWPCSGQMTAEDRGAGRPGHPHPGVRGRRRRALTEPQINALVSDMLAALGPSDPGSEGPLPPYDTAGALDNGSGPGHPDPGATVFASLCALPRSRRHGATRVGRWWMRPTWPWSAIRPCERRSWLAERTSGCRTGAKTSQVNRSPTAHFGRGGLARRAARPVVGRSGSSVEVRHSGP